MFTLYSATQIDMGFERGIIINESIKDEVMAMEKNNNYKLNNAIASEKTMKKLEPQIDAWIATAATPEAPGARYALLAPNKNGTLSFVQW